VWLCSKPGRLVAQCASISVAVCLMSAYGLGLTYKSGVDFAEDLGESLRRSLDDVMAECGRYSVEVAYTWPRASSTLWSQISVVMQRGWVPHKEAVWVPRT